MEHLDLDLASLNSVISMSSETDARQQILTNLRNYMILTGWMLTTLTNDWEHWVQPDIHTEFEGLLSNPEISIPSTVQYRDFDNRIHNAVQDLAEAHKLPYWKIRAAIMSDKEQKDYDEARLAIREAQQEADGDWLGLKHDRPHKDPGRVRCAKTARSQSKKRRETLPFLRNQIGWSIEDAAEAFKVRPRDIEHFELEPESAAPIGYLTFLAQEARKLGWNVDLCGEDGWLDVYHDDDLS